MRNQSSVLTLLLDSNCSNTLRPQNHICTSDFIVDCDNDPTSFVPLSGGDGTFLLDTSMSKVSVMELVHNGFLYPHETKAVSPKPSIYTLTP